MYIKQRYIYIYKTKDCFSLIILDKKKTDNIEKQVKDMSRYITEKNTSGQQT